MGELIQLPVGRQCGYCGKRPVVMKWWERPELWLCAECVKKGIQKDPPFIELP